MTLIVPIDKPEDVHPINAFPVYIQEIINHYSDSKGYTIEFFIQAFLAATSASLGRSVTLNTGNYTSIGLVWCIILGKRGFVKSEPLDDAFAPIKKYQFEIYSKHNTDTEELKEYIANNPKAKVTELPQPKKVLLSDTTPEKLVMILAENPKGCTIVYDEIAGFVRRFNRYNSGADEEMYLSLFNGGNISRDRINGNSAFAKNSYLTIIGTTQPSVLKEVFSGKSESGFFDRWLITRPDNVKKQYPNQFGIDPVEEAKYDNLLRRLLHIEYDELNFNQMTYTVDSYKIINDYQRHLIDEENDTDNEDYRGILAKIEIYLHRFALLLQSLQYAISGDILDLYKVCPESANGAVILAKYFINEAMKVRVSTPVELLKDKWIDIYKSLPEHGTKFDRKTFIKICGVHEIKDRAADNFLREHGMRSEMSLFFKVGHGIYTKNLF